MVDAQEIVGLQNNQDTNQNQLFKLAQVTSLTENGTAIVQFNGESTPSLKEYSYLSSYKPNISDTVLMSKMLDTYIILGSVKYKQVPSVGDYITLDSLNSTLQNYITADNLNNYLTAYAKTTDLDSCVKLNSNNIFILPSSQYYNSLPNLKVNSFLWHNGSQLGFFGTTPTIKRSLNTVSESDTTSMSTCLHYINNIVETLQGYGLF